MKKLVVAAAAALTVAVVASVALAGTPALQVKAVGSNYVIKGKAPSAKGGNIVAMNIEQHGVVVAGDDTYTPPSAANGYKFKVVAKQSELPAGKYVLEIVNDTASGVSYIKFKFTIK
jgi:hypothetical protein